MSNHINDLAAVAVAALAVQAAVAEAKVAAAGGPSSAWAISASIADASFAAATTHEDRAAIFDMAARSAAKSFESERTKAGATCGRWIAFSTAKSTHRNALALGIFSLSLSKTETSKAIKVAKEAATANARSLAKKAGLI